jgi:hypothetical protein
LCRHSGILNPTPLYGVAGYTYNWSTGATSPTITVGVTPAVYTCTVTDACGTSVVATFNMGCPLPVRLNSFDASLKNEKTFITWETLSEDGIEKFNLEKSDATGNYIPIYSTESKGNEGGAVYQFIDSNPFVGITYYRLVLVYDSGDLEYSDPVSVIQKEETIQIVPNPSNGVFNLTISTPEQDEILIEVVNSSGVIIYSEVIKSTDDLTKHQMDLTHQPKGIYAVRIISAGKSTY